MAQTARQAANVARLNASRAAGTAGSLSAYHTMATPQLSTTAREAQARASGTAVYNPKTGTTTPVASSGTAAVVPTNSFKPVAYSAPNRKNYVINDYGTGGASFIGQDGTIKKYNSLAEAQKAINEGNPAGGGMPNYGDIQQKYNDKMAAAGHVTWENVPSTLEMPDTSEMSPEDAAKAMEDYNFNSRMDSLQKSLTGSFNKLGFENAEFKKNVEKNMIAQLAKNQALQDELRANKAAIDAEFSTVKNKFDENTKASLERIDKLEETYMAQLNNIKGLQSDYYDTQMQATNDRVAGEQAGLTNRLSAAGVNEYAIGNALGMARIKYGQQFADIKNDNIKVLNDLNNAYKDFANNINKQKNEFNQEDIILLTKRFEYLKDIEDAGKTINNDLINATFKPYEDAITAISTQQNQEMGYEAGDQYIAERYNSGTAADRESLLQSKFSALGVSMYGKGELSKFDLAALKKAATLPNYAEALQYLMNVGSSIAGTSSANGSVLPEAAKQKAANSKEDSNVPEAKLPKIDLDLSSIGNPFASLGDNSLSVIPSADVIQSSTNQSNIDKQYNSLAVKPGKLTNPTTIKQIQAQFKVANDKVDVLTKQYNATLGKSYVIGSPEELKQRQILSDLNKAKEARAQIVKGLHQLQNEWIGKTGRAIDNQLTVI